MYSDNDDELMTDIKEKWERPSRTDNHLTLAFIIVSLSLSVLGASYYYHLKHMEALVAEAKVKNSTVYFKPEKITKTHSVTKSKSKYRASTSEHPQQYKIPTLTNHSYIEQSRSNKLTRRRVIQKSPYTQQQRLARSQRIKRDAQRGNAETCNYWSKQYRKENSDESKRMMLDSCKRAGYAIRTNPQTQSNIIINNINDYRNNTPSQKNGCVSLTSCTNYKYNLNRILSRMREGYTASQYNYLEDTRKHWRNKLFDDCKCYKTNSF